MNGEMSADSSSRAVGDVIDREELQWLADRIDTEDLVIDQHDTTRALVRAVERGEDSEVSVDAPAFWNVVMPNEFRI